MNLDVMMAVAGTLLMLCVYANRISMRYGIPSLLLFLSLGMLAGSDGAGIQFYNARIANYIGTSRSFSPAVLLQMNDSPPLARGSLLSTLGVFLPLFYNTILGLT
ncbi:MAG: hypothetical protein ACLSE6_03625 [Alphaproteobacteria bacterium]